MEKNIDIQQTLFFSFLKKTGLKNKKHWLFNTAAYENEAINILGF